MICWFDVIIKLVVDMGWLTALVSCFDMLLRCEVGGWWLRILVCCFHVSMFIIWFRVRGICNFVFIVDIRFWWYLRVLSFFIFLLLFLLKLANKGEYERICFHTSLILVAQPVVIYIYRTSPASLICFFKINPVTINILDAPTIPYIMIQGLTYFLRILACYESFSSSMECC